MKKFAFISFFLFILAASAAAFFYGYSYIFALNIRGVIEGVEKPINPVAVVDTGSGEKSARDKVFFSYAVAIRDLKTNEIHTSSAEDRQWAVAEKGKCVEAKFYPYPPWNLEKAGTYFGARLLKMYDCSTFQ